MRASIRDTATLTAIRPLDLLTYLRSTGWQADRTIRGGSFWVKDDFEVSVPVEEQLRDFGLRMAEVLATLEAAEGRSQLEVLVDLSEASTDIVRVRAHCPEFADGSVPIDKAVELVEHARDMMMASACAAVRPSAYFPSRKPTPATEYMERLRMGQTERGSFVVTILSRVAPVLTPAEAGQLFPDVGDPFERQVTRTLANALAATQAAAVSAAATGSIDAFMESIQQGVSANLCAAVAGMSRFAAGDDELTLTLSWARTRPIAEGTPRSVVFAPDTVEVIEEAARVLRATGVREEFELRGIVVRTHRETNAEIGDVTILGFVDDQLRRVRVELEPGPYNVAVNAHQERRPIVCRGRLTREGRRFALQQPYGLAEEADDSDDDN